MNTWFTSDTHFGHENIIKYCERPFRDLAHMDEELIRRWNSRVKPTDYVFELGDFNFRNSSGGKAGEGVTRKVEHYEKLLNGNVIHIRGNHSSNNGCNTPIEKIIIKYGGHRIGLVHNPTHADLNYEFNFVGHVHNFWKFKKVIVPNQLRDVFLINVGVDVWNFYPVNIHEIMRDFWKWKKAEKREEKNSQNG